jgi:hypothetical protein
MKRIFTLILLSVFVLTNAQQKKEEVNTLGTIQQRSSSLSSSSSSSSSGLSDVILPKSSPFQLGKNVEGAIQNSINKSSGKVLFSLPIASVTANTVGYNVSISYNGAAASEMANKTNKFSPTGILGVGFGFSVPKIIADYKNTAVKDDDTYYFADGNNSKLICTKKTATYLEFKSEKYAPWKIKYILKRSTGFTQQPNGQWVETFAISDSWEIIKEDGTIYQFGKEDEGLSPGTGSKVRISTWGNWIGDSNQNPTGVITSEWNLYKIKDQWDNKITFLYEKVNGKQNTSQQGYFHTEAIYLKEIKSSDNSKIVFNYGNKIPQEYFEPHTEQSEPDAFQEKYEKKYLQNIQTFNSNNELIFKYKLEYDLIDHTDPTKPYRGKRLLRKLIQENKDGESLPPQEFEYHTTGGFKGKISKITYPTGGTVTYNYKKKIVFTNTANRFSGNQPNVSGYYLKGSYNAGNYVLDLYRSQNPVSGSLYRYKIVRYHWTGSTWNINEFTLPYYLPWEQCIDYGDIWNGSGCNTVYLDGFKIVHGADYYALMHFNRSGNWAKLNLFHLKSDGKTWSSVSYAPSSVESKNETPYTEDPELLSGNDFVAIGTKRTGELRTYSWNGNSWNYKYIDQGDGEYYYAARNNFILSLNEDGGRDLSNNVTYADNYYMHYLDSEKTWQTKSWTQRALQTINTIERASYFYPSNSMTSFMAHDNPEYFLRWDTDYNLVNIDNVIGSVDDNIPFQNLSSGFYSLGFLPSGALIRTTRFNGVNWNLLDHGYYQGIRKYSAALGKDAIFYEKSGSSRLWYLMYNANANSWLDSNFNNSVPNFYDFKSSTQIFDNFLLGSNSIFKREEQPFSSVLLSPYQLIESIPFNIGSSTTNGLGGVYTSSLDGFHHHNPNYISSSINTRLYYANKSSKGVSNINFNGKFGMKGMKMFGGYQQFFNGSSIYVRNKGTFHQKTNTNSFDTYLYQIIDDNVNQDVEDVVVDYIQIDNKLDPVRKVNYEFDQYTFLPNESVYYGKATTEQKGYGSANNGKVVSYSNTGTTDMRLLGTPTKTEIKDANNILKSETVYNTSVFTKRYSNSSNVTVGQGYYVRTTKKTESIKQENGTLTSAEEYVYNDLGLIDTKKVIYNNNESSVVTNTTYAHELFPFLNAKNILNKPSKLVQKKGNDIIGTSETKWKVENGKVFPYQTLAGISTTKVLSEITKVNNLGLAEEESNGKGIFNVNLLSYDNKYQVARISNANYNQVIANLDVSYVALQNLSTSSLKTELLKLYSKLPKASITLSFYDNNGNLISNIDARKEEINHFYDSFNRLIYSTDSQGNKLTQTEYKFKQ